MLFFLYSVIHVAVWMVSSRFRQYHYEIVQTQRVIRGSLILLYEPYYELIPINNSNIFVIRYSYYAANAGCDCRDEVTWAVTV